MANTLDSVGAALTSGGGNTTLYTCPALTRTTILSVSFANTYSSALSVSLGVAKGGSTEYRIVYQMNVGQNSTLVAVGEGQKIVLEPTDVLKAQVHTASGTADVFVSYLEIT